MNPTKETYKQVDKAYTHFNKNLFNGKLPACIITFQRKKNAYGYFKSNSWEETDGEGVTDEIALNPSEFISRGLENVLSTLVHEMCHLQQYHEGNPSRNGYHNKEWSEMMAAVGLISSSTGQVGGRKTGQRITHYIEEGGRYQKAFDQLTKKRFSIPWQAFRDEGAAAKKRATKTKYTCPGCGLNAWGKVGLDIRCGTCEKALKA